MAGEPSWSAAVLLPESFRGGCSFGATTSVVSPAVDVSDESGGAKSIAPTPDSGLLVTAARVEADPDGDVVAGHVGDLHVVDDLDEIGRLRRRLHGHGDLVELGIERGRVGALDSKAQREVDTGLVARWAQHQPADDAHLHGDEAVGDRTVARLLVDHRLVLQIVRVPDLALSIVIDRLGAGPDLDRRALGGDGRQRRAHGSDLVWRGGRVCQSLGARRGLAAAEHPAHRAGRKHGAQSRHSRQTNADCRRTHHAIPRRTHHWTASACRASRMAGAPLTVTPATSCTNSFSTTPSRITMAKRAKRRPPSAGKSLASPIASANRADGSAMKSILPSASERSAQAFSTW